LVATQTGTLEELIAYTSPEVRAGAKPTTASDVYGICAIYLALLTGSHIDASQPLEDHGLAPHTVCVVASAMSENPQERPSASVLLSTLRGHVADIRELEGRDAGSSSSGMRMFEERRVDLPALAVEPSLSWQDSEIDALLACDHPIFQPVLDREGRTLILASWPEGTRRLDGRVDYQRHAPMAALEDMPQEVAQALRQRIGVTSWVVTPGDAWMLALDDLLTR